jgi:hypothetical protein
MPKTTSAPSLDFNDLLSLSGKTKQVRIGKGSVDVRALTASEEAYCVSLTEEVRPPALKRKVLATDAKGNTIPGTTSHEEVYDYDWTSPDYLTQRQKAERQQMLWTAYFGTPSLNAGAQDYGDNDEDRVQKLGEKISQSLIDRLSAAISILTRSNDQGIADFFSDGGLSYFQGSKTSSTTTASPSDSTAPATSEPSDTASSTTNIETSNAPDGGATSSASGSTKATATAPAA